MGSPTQHGKMRTISVSGMKPFKTFKQFQSFKPLKSDVALKLFESDGLTF